MFELVFVYNIYTESSFSYLLRCLKLSYVIGFQYVPEAFLTVSCTSLGCQKFGYSLTA
jgi:hypothetical protein